jgi:hypothetical protein
MTRKARNILTSGRNVFCGIEVYKGSIYFYDVRNEPADSESDPPINAPPSPFLRYTSVSAYSQRHLREGPLWYRVGDDCTEKEMFGMGGWEGWNQDRKT